MNKQKIKIFKEAEVEFKDPVRRIFYLERAERRAQNPEFKELWRLKKEQLLKKYNI
tara:strand:- start:434 stop:601 length:168 start_codon:yes stop_codon:yes gene_type:complete